MSDTVAEPVRVLRLIARLNMGGPALHVSYLTRGLAERGYETTLVAGSLAHGESSMSFVADELGVEVIPIRQLHREVSPLSDALTVARLVKLMQEVEPQLNNELHSKVTQLLVELTAYDLMKVFHSMHAARPKTVFRG